MEEEMMKKSNTDTVVASEQEEVTEQGSGEEVMFTTEMENVAPEDVVPVEETGLLRDNRGVGVVEIILILVVLIALVVIFKDQLTGMVTKAMEALERSMSEVLS